MWHWWIVLRYNVIRDDRNIYRSLSGNSDQGEPFVETKLQSLTLPYKKRKNVQAPCCCCSLNRVLNVGKVLYVYTHGFPFPSVATSCNESALQRPIIKSCSNHVWLHLCIDMYSETIFCSNVPSEPHTFCPPAADRARTLRSGTCRLENGF